MGNNMELDYEMFCYQCEQTANGKGCTKLGVCGKTPEIAALQDLLIFQIKGISFYGKPLIEQGAHMDKSMVSFIENVLFTTLTNVNFDAAAHVELLKRSQQIKDELRSMSGDLPDVPAHAAYHLPDTKSEMLHDAPLAGIMYDKSLDPDVRSLRQTILYGLKGISAYGHQARELGYYSDEVNDFYILALEALTDDKLTAEELIRMMMRTGEMAIEVMKKLDEANTTIYQNPAPHNVNVHIKKGPFIIVSGHDLKALELGGFPEVEEALDILVGFGHHAALSYANGIVSAVKNKQLRHFFLIGGCDGARPGRNYYTEFAKMVPDDCMILTLACGKYCFNKLDFGEVAGLPRLLDVGQCNDVYSAIHIATALADAFETDVNGLPLSLIVSWYEQKAVADLLALLSLGIRNIYLGPTLPAFLSPNVLQYLTDTFHLRLISNAEDDIKTCLRQAV